MRREVGCAAASLRLLTQKHFAEQRRVRPRHLFVLCRRHHFGAHTREHLLQATRVHEDIFDRSIDVQVLRLRRKLETDPSAPRVIQTERGVGYIFALAVEPF